MTTQDNANTTITHELNGLTKKELFAKEILCSLLSKYSLNNPEDQNTITQLSVELADTLLKKLND